MLVYIDGAAIESRDDLHDALMRQLRLPEWYGRNLDALYDCLTDMGEDTEVRLLHADELIAHLGVYGSVLQTMLRDACEENPHLSFMVEEG